MGQQMTELQRTLVADTIREADPCPDDIEDCVQRLMDENILSLKKVRTFRVELQQVCQKALDARGAPGARDAAPPTPPTSAITPPSSADPRSGTLQDDGALLAAACNSRDTPEIVSFYYNGSFHPANSRSTNTELSYIREKRVSNLGLKCTNGTVQLEWKYAGPPPDGDHTMRETVFVLVSEEEASRVKMNVDVVFGQHCNKEVNIQLQAVRASMNLQSDPSPFEVQPDESCAGSVAEAAMLPTQAFKSPPPQLQGIFLFVGPNQVERATELYASLGYATPQSGAHGVPV